MSKKKAASVVAAPNAKVEPAQAGEPRRIPGRNGKGTLTPWGPGNRGAPGNPHAALVAKIRQELFRSTPLADVRRVWRTLIKLAIEGDTTAAGMVLDRLVGKAAPPADETRSERPVIVLNVQNGPPDARNGVRTVQVSVDPSPVTPTE